jgi:hypothetical protein
MFSSFSSFLISVPQSSQEQRSHQSLSTPNNDAPEPDVDSQPPDYTATDSKLKKRDKREKLVNEVSLILSLSNTKGSTT